MKLSKSVRYFFPTLALTFCGTAFATIPQSERDALLQLYKATGGATWTYHDGWTGASGTECQWVGIDCDAGAQHVVALQLLNNNLTGVLPDLSGLPKLQRIAVGSNALTGALPKL